MTGWDRNLACSEVRGIGANVNVELRDYVHMNTGTLGRLHRQLMNREITMIMVVYMNELLMQSMNRIPLI